ncbi:MAG: hypothetical protein SO401_03740, partial [Blautia sp.]|nr:hypothetical protein [Blautia sp.]MDY5554241.1 hypothetical protein [Blautia sp.]
FLSEYSLLLNLPPGISENRIFPQIRSKVLKTPSNHYLEGDFYIVYENISRFVLFQLIFHIRMLTKETFDVPFLHRSSLWCIIEKISKLWISKDIR